MTASLEVAMIHDGPYEAIDPKDVVARAQSVAFEQACEINGGNPNRDMGALAIAQKVQDEALEKASSANLMTPSMLPASQENTTHGH